MVTGAEVIVAGGLVAVGAAIAGSEDKGADMPDEIIEPQVEVEPQVGAKEPSIVTIDLVTANAEYEYRVPTGCKKFLMQMRDGLTFKVATVKNGTKTLNPQYFTIRTDGAVWWDNLNVVDSREAVFYLACTGTNKVVEIWQWS